MEINIKTIPIILQRYRTAGDYWEKGGKIQVRVSRQKKWQYEALIAIHELVELFLVKQRKISIASIDKFDKEMEKYHVDGATRYIHTYPLTRIKKGILGSRVEICYGVDCLKSKKGMKENNDEPGICAHAPYHKEHMAAMKIEKLLCKEFGISWDEYNKYVCSL